MHFLDGIEGKKWLAERSLDARLSSSRDHYAFRTSCALPADTGKKTCLARCIVQLFQSLNETVGLFITGYMVWPSCENMALFDVARKGMGEERPVWIVPNQVCESEDDLVKLECLLDIVLYFYWDAIVINESGNLLVKTSNDEILGFFCERVDVMDSLKATLNAMELNVKN